MWNIIWSFFKDIGRTVELATTAWAALAAAAVTSSITGVEVPTAAMAAAEAAATTTATGGAGV